MKFTPSHQHLRSGDTCWVIHKAGLTPELATLINDPDDGWTVSFGPAYGYAVNYYFGDKIEPPRRFSVNGRNFVHNPPYVPQEVNDALSQELGLPSALP